MYTVNENDGKAVCNICKKDYVWRYGQGTGTLRRHKEKHLNETGHLHSRQTQITSFTNASGSVTFTNFVYSQERMRVGMSEFLAAREMPFTFAEDQYFEEFLQKYIQPSYRSVSRNTARSDSMKLFHTMAENLKNDFEKIDGIICFTSDCWSGRNHNGYACVTAHFIDNNWLLHKRIIAFRLLEYPHNGVNLCENLLQVFNEFGVLNKLFSYI